MRVGATLRACVLAAAAMTVTQLAAAQGNGLEVQPGDTIRSVLEARMGRPVKLKLTSGAELAGRVAKVGDHVVQLSELTGAEFFEAVVPIEDVEAVIVRTKP
jgi:hypothetical protein